ncbi:uncharacterized protein K444DRAFT_392408 [Hyaloscypha bicolor E]|uniref:Uncharacterized protein n=1 Tax=Hyaloscypha bicolor E TaxID=1095630 RepID=A0A2J6TBL5_9HELO|nr:uncharacterized protein K444DRAFT_392408 [Hyaloscypha bicolor E]PMD60414.1 hypothetical protein K444DRAFT_392408 [Hyaloscypha bicolor E]
MSKTGPKKSAKPEEKLKAKEEEKKKGDGHEEGEHKPQTAEQKWSDWIWDEEMKLYYRAKLANGVEWIYDYACPELHPATKKEKVNIISEKFEFPKVEEKIVFVQPKYKFEVPSGRGSEYLVSVCEEMRAGPGMRGGSGKPAGGNAEEKAAEPVKVEGEAKAGGEEEGKKKNVAREQR